MHIPVLLQEVISCLNITPGKKYIDATFGAGGYTRRILELGGSVLAIDRDPSVAATAAALQLEHPDKFEFVNTDFGSIGNLGKDNFDGIVFDLGVSSMQLDQAHRGFSFQENAQLDMRMDTRQTLTAYTVVNSLPEEQLANLIYNLGDERKSRAIAHAIVQARHSAPITSTTELASIIVGVVGKYNDKIHPATRTFQAIRMYVNDELLQLRNGLEGAINDLAPGGILCVVAFHSGEDEIVKEYFKQLVGPRKHYNKYSHSEEQKKPFEYIAKLKPSKDETRRNPRARSAILRAIAKIS